MLMLFFTYSKNLAIFFSKIASKFRDDSPKSSDYLFFLIITFWSLFNTALTTWEWAQLNILGKPIYSRKIFQVNQTHPGFPLVMCLSLLQQSWNWNFGTNFYSSRFSCAEISGIAEIPRLRNSNGFHGFLHNSKTGLFRNLNQIFNIKVVVPFKLYSVLDSGASEGGHGRIASPLVFFSCIFLIKLA